MIASFLSNYFLPRRRLSYYGTYLRFWRSIHEDGNIRSKGTIWLILCLVGLLLLKNIAIELLCPSTVTRIILYDSFELIPQLAGSGFIKVLMLAMEMSLIYLNYLKGGPSVCGLVYDDLYKNNWDSFIWAKYHHVHICQYLRHFALNCLLIAPPLSAVTYIFLLYMYILFWLKILKNSDFFFGSFTCALCLVLFHLNGALFSFVFIGIEHIWLLSSSMGLLLTRIAFVRMEQIMFYLGRRFHVTLYHITVMHRITIINLWHINKGGQLYGLIFLIFFLCDMPVNLQLTIFLLFRRHGLMERLWMLSLVIFQLIGIFGFHAIMALYSKRIHQPSKLLIHHLVRNPTISLNIKCRLKLTYLISLLHTTQPYGLSYGPLGLVTLTTFGKFILLYFKFLLIVYKMHKKLDPSLSN